MNTLFQGIFDNSTTQVIEPMEFILCMAASLFSGIILWTLTLRHQKNNDTFNVCIALLPCAVCVVIMMVNGNIGASLSVAGAFSLIRFRSSQGNAAQITTVFIAMVSGLMVGMGYLAYALLFTVIMAVCMNVYTIIEAKRSDRFERYLYVTIPESLDYTGVLDPVLDTYADHYSLEHVRTTNMGSLFRLTYRFALRKECSEKEMMDEIRCHNGNLEVHIARCQPYESAGM
ncbi:MAG: DUF4956 domain-containing protein [Bulleidia sp.]